MKHAVRLALLAAAALLPAVAPAADDGKLERERITRERAAANAHYAEQERECRGRFLVTACIDQAQAERRETMEHLRAQQRVLDEAERKRRAAERVQAIRDRIEQAPSQPVPPMNIRAPRADAADAAASGAAAPTAAPKAHRSRRPPLESADRAERESAARARFEQRQREGEQRRLENERRNAERRKPNAKPSAPLPLPDDVPPPAPTRP